MASVHGLHEAEQVDLEVSLLDVVHEPDAS